MKDSTRIKINEFQTSIVEKSITEEMTEYEFLASLSGLLLMRFTGKISDRDQEESPKDSEEIR